MKHKLTAVLLILTILVTGYFVADLLLRPQMAYDTDGNPAKHLPPIIYYTIQTNIMAIVWLAGITMAYLGVVAVRRMVWHPAVTLPLAIYITLTGLVYWAVLMPMLGATAFFFSLSNIWMHTVTPVLVVLLVLRNASPGRMRHVWSSLVYPLAYLILSLVVAHNTGKYTYPFLNPAVMRGWGGVALACVLLAGVFLSIGRVYLGWMKRSPAIFNPWPKDKDQSGRD